MYQNRDYTSEITRLVETKTIENEKETKNKNKKKEQIDFQNYDKKAWSKFLLIFYIVEGFENVCS